MVGYVESEQKLFKLDVRITEPAAAIPGDCPYVVLRAAVREMVQSKPHYCSIQSLYSWHFLNPQ